ncbi:ribonuclease III [uncultured Clostridium sp.]|uniref:ribonuclease III n=1 Tax=uncultured Clostridium sp. TaxID=59620 RepID=UPI00260A5D42|nr:ribonuclease III [uncultured Clostridium sp.]
MNKLKLKEMEASLGVTFTNLSYLRVALTHSSFANQYKDSEYNERLEFLGDSVLQLSVTEYLYKNYKEKSEGELTKIRSLIVCENSLFEVAKSVSVGAYIRMSRGEELTGGRNRVSIQADAIEAVIAAIYLDKGFEYAREFILNKFHDIIDKAINNKIILDFKTKLQEYLQQNGEVNITYELVKFEGPPHRRKFYTTVLINGGVKGEGEGFSKKEAEQKAAKKALVNLEVINE